MKVSSIGNRTNGNITRSNEFNHSNNDILLQYLIYSNSKLKRKHSYTCYYGKNE